MKRLLLYFITIASLLGCVQKQTITAIDDIESFKKAIVQEDIQLVDIRRADEYERGFIGNALHIDFLQKDHFKKEVAKLDKDKPIYIYCHSGGRSKRATAVLEEMGFAKIYDFSLGYKGWSQAK